MANITQRQIDGKLDSWIRVRGRLPDAQEAQSLFTGNGLTSTELSQAVAQANIRNSDITSRIIGGDPATQDLPAQALPIFDPPSGDVTPPTQALPIFDPPSGVVSPPTTGGGPASGLQALLNQLLGPQLGPQQAGTKTIQDILADMSALSPAFQTAAANGDFATMEAIVKQGGLLLNQAQFLQSSTQFDTATKNSLDLANKELENQVLAIESAAKQSGALNLTNITLQQLENLGGLAGIQARQAGQNVTQQTANQGLLNVAQQQGISDVNLQTLLNQGNLNVQGLQNTGDLNLQALLNQGNLGVVGAQGSNQLLLQQLLNAGNLGIQGLQNQGQLSLQQLLNQGNLSSQGLQNQGQLSLQQLLNQGNLAGIQAQGGTAVDIANIQAAIDQAALANSNTQFQQSLGLQSQLGLGNLGVQQGQLQLDQLLGLGGLGIQQGQLDLNQLLGVGGLNIQQGQLSLNELLGTGGLAFDFSQLAQQGQQFQQNLGFNQQQLGQQNEQFLMQLELSKLELQAQTAAQNAATAQSGSNAGLVAAAAANELAEFKRQFGITQPEDVRQFDVSNQTNLQALLSQQQNVAVQNPFGAFGLSLLGGNPLALPELGSVAGVGTPRTGVGTPTQGVGTPLGSDVAAAPVAALPAAAGTPAPTTRRKKPISGFGSQTVGGRPLGSVFRDLGVAV